MAPAPEASSRSWLIFCRVKIDSGARPEKSNASGPAPETNGYLALFHDDRNLSSAIGITQHFVQVLRVFFDIKVLKGFSCFVVRLTGGSGKRSGAFAENQDGGLFRHNCSTSYRLEVNGFLKKDLSFFITTRLAFHTLYYITTEARDKAGLAPELYEGLIRVIPPPAYFPGFF